MRWRLAGNTKERRRGTSNEGNNQRPLERKHGLQVGVRLSIQFISIGVSTKIIVRFWCGVEKPLGRKIAVAEPVDPRLAHAPSYILRARCGRASPGKEPGVI